MDSVEKSIVAAVVFVLVALLVLIGWLVWDEVTADKFSLRKDEWRCTKSHHESQAMMAGKVPVITSQTVCDIWERQ